MNTAQWSTLIVVSALLSATGCEREPTSTYNTTPTTSPNSTSTSTPSSTTQTRTVPDADNTARNRGDADEAARTPVSQSESPSDIDITAAIRRAIMDDDSMSMNAQNCKIITDKSGVVTLRGVVNSQAEKDAIEGKAKSVAGVTRVDNQLEIKTS